MVDNSLLYRIKQCFAVVPEDDARADIGPRAFVVTLIFCFLRDRGERTLANLRRNLMSETGETIARSTFWNRLATKRCQTLLLLVIAEILKKNLSVHVRFERAA